VEDFKTLRVGEGSTIYLTQKDCPKLPWVPRLPAPKKRCLVTRGAATKAISPTVLQYPVEAQP